MYDETLNTAVSLIKRTWHLRRVMSLPYKEFYQKAKSLSPK